MTRVLIVDDEAIITDSLRYSLTRHEFEVDIAASGEDALELAAASPPDVVVLDVRLPGLDGWGVLRALRAQSAVPIIMLTALDAEKDRVYGLELGADDYLVKPFGFRELLARIRAILRRQALDMQQDKPAALAVGPVAVNLDRRQAHLNDELLDLPTREFELLATLVTYAGTVLPRDKLLDLVWGIDWIGDVRTLDVHIHGLRQKIEPDPAHPRYILTIRGVGYRFISPDELS